MNLNQFTNVKNQFSKYVIYNVMLAERKRRNLEVGKCSARTVCNVHITKTPLDEGEIRPAPSALKPD